MIEQTDLVVTQWLYHEPKREIGESEQIPNSISFEVQKKRTSEKKGLACRFSCQFTFEDETVLQYVGEDSYVIDPEDRIDKNELLKMIKNAYSKYKEVFDFRKLGTVLQGRSLTYFDETKLDLDPILPLLV
jgi:hypothetical protein